MLTIKPFRGLSYNRNTVDIQSVVSPPYDVIANTSQYSEYNIVHIDLNKNKNLYDDLLMKGLLVVDQNPGIYIYRQDYVRNNEILYRTGFIALAKIEEYQEKVILPHEDTIKKHVDDRIDSLKIFRTHFNPVFVLYEGTLLLDVEKEPIIDVIHDGIRNRIWPIYDERKLQYIQNEMLKKRVFIADGHHRYKAGLEYYHERHEAEFIMMYFTSMSENLTILPYHRVLDVKIDSNRIKSVFKLDHYRGKRKDTNGITMYCDGNYASLNPINQARLSDIIELHKMLYGLDIKIDYTKDEAEAITMADKRSSVAFLVKPIETDEIMRVCNAGKLFPEKATYFYPKLLSGLIMYTF